MNSGAHETTVRRHGCADHGLGTGNVWKRRNAIGLWDKRDYNPVMSLPNKNLLRPDEVADYFSVTRSTVYNWIDSGRPAAAKVSGTIIRITRASIENLQKSPHE